MHALLRWEAKLSGHLITHPHKVGAVLQQYSAAGGGSSTRQPINLIGASGGQPGAGQPATRTGGRRMLRSAARSTPTCQLSPASWLAGNSAGNPHAANLAPPAQHRQPSAASSAAPAHPERPHHLLQREQCPLLRRLVSIVSQAILLGLHHPALCRIRCRPGSAKQCGQPGAGRQAGGRVGERAGRQADGQAGGRAGRQVGRGSARQLA